MFISVLILAKAKHEHNKPYFLLLLLIFYSLVCCWSSRRSPILMQMLSYHSAKLFKLWQGHLRASELPFLRKQVVWIFRTMSKVVCFTTKTYKLCCTLPYRHLFCSLIPLWNPYFLTEWLVQSISWSKFSLVLWVKQCLVTTLCISPSGRRKKKSLIPDIN